jgi:predicted kinase
VPPLFLLIGLPGSGNTTLARQLEAEHSPLHLTPDEWMTPLFGAGGSGDRRWILEAWLLWGVAAHALTLGMSVIPDYGCWTREERDLFRARAAELAVQFGLHVQDVPLAELWRRLEARNLNLLPDTFPVTRAELGEWAGWDAMPGPDELVAAETPSFSSKVWRWSE